MPLPGYREQFMAQPLPGPASGLDRVAVGAQRDHLLWVVRTAFGEIVNVVHFQDRMSGVGDVLPAAGLPARAHAAHQAAGGARGDVPGRPGADLVARAYDAAGRH